MVVFDASVLINFLCIDRLDLIQKHSSDYIVSEHVNEEISYSFPDQRKRLDGALNSGIINVVSIHSEKELNLLNEIFANTKGWGESSAFALAICRNYTVAIDDKSAIKYVKSKGYNLKLQGTHDIVVSMIHEELLNVSEADQIKKIWEVHHNFALNFASFSDIMPHQTR